MNGCLRLFFEHSAGRGTVLHVREQRPPLQVVRAFPSTCGTLVHLHNLSGGVLGGDQLELSIELAAGASAQITSTGATRVYRDRGNGQIACCRTEIRLGENSLLELLPDPLIPFRQARFEQHTMVDLAPGASLFWWETLAPGREAAGEIFAYDSVHLSAEIRSGGVPVALDRARLIPSERSLASPLRLGSYRYLTTFYVCRSGFEGWAAMEEKLASICDAQRQPGVVEWGTSTLPRHGVVVRGIGNSAQAISSGLVEFWQAAKLLLTGQKATLPRKTY